MRTIYLDETGHDKDSRATAVAGLIIDHDTQWRALSEEIEDLKGRVPEKFREGFYFHAKDLQHGGKYRHEWDAEDRWSLLDDLIAIPRKHRIPLVLGTSTLPEGRTWDHQQSIIVHALAYSLCLAGADRFMREMAGPDEAAMVVVEERREASKALRAVQKLVSSQDLRDQWIPKSLADKIPLITRIKLPPAFASKDEEVLLQIADACAYVFKRFIHGAHDADRRLGALFGNDWWPAQLGEIRESAAVFRCFYWISDQEDAPTSPPALHP